MEQFVATLTVCMGKRENGKEERRVWQMQQAAKSNREHLISVQLPPNAMKKQKTKKEMKRKEYTSKKKREEKTENDCFSFIKMSFYYGKSSWPIAEVRCQRRWGVKLSKAAATTTAAVKRAANLCAISTGNG